MTVKEVGSFLYNFKGKEHLYPGYDGVGYCLLGLVRDNKLLELYSTESILDESTGTESMVNLNRLQIENMNYHLLEKLHYSYVDKSHLLSTETLFWLLDNKVVVKEWVESYISKMQDKLNNHLLDFYHFFFVDNSYKLSLETVAYLYQNNILSINMLNTILSSYVVEE